MTWLASWLQLGGLVAGFVAALFLAIAQGGVSGDDTVMERDAERPGEPPRYYRFVFLRHPCLWRAGLVLLVVGFALQLLGYLLIVTRRS
jgi:hypothetical protein